MPRWNGSRTAALAAGLAAATAALAAEPWQGWNPPPVSICAEPTLDALERFPELLRCQIESALASRSPSKIDREGPTTRYWFGSEIRWRCDDLPDQFRVWRGNQLILSLRETGSEVAIWRDQTVAYRLLRGAGEDQIWEGAHRLRYRVVATPTGRQCFAENRPADPEAVRAFCNGIIRQVLSWLGPSEPATPDCDELGLDACEG